MPEFSRTSPGLFVRAVNRMGIRAIVDALSVPQTRGGYRPVGPPVAMGTPPVGPGPIAVNPKPVEHCGHIAPLRPATECVLRPGHQGSHADDAGMRWWPISPDADPEPDEDDDTPNCERLTYDQHNDNTITALYRRAEKSHRLAKALASRYGTAAKERDRLDTELHTTESELVAARSAIERVRALHHPAECVNVRCSADQWCIGCDPEGLDDCTEHPYPCPTIAVLDQPKAV